jgi:hypothetical protein
LTTPVLKTNFNSKRIASQKPAARSQRPQKPPSMMKGFCLLFPDLSAPNFVNFQDAENMLFTKKKSENC